MACIDTAAAAKTISATKCIQTSRAAQGGARPHTSARHDLLTPVWRMIAVEDPDLPPPHGDPGAERIAAFRCLRFVKNSLRHHLRHDLTL